MRGRAHARARELIESKTDGFVSEAADSGGTLRLWTTTRTRRRVAPRRREPVETRRTRRASWVDSRPISARRRRAARRSSLSATHDLDIENTRVVAFALALTGPPELASPVGTPRTRRAAPPAAAADASRTAGTESAADARSRPRRGATQASTPPTPPAAPAPPSPPPLLSPPPPPPSPGMAMTWWHPPHIASDAPGGCSTIAAHSGHFTMLFGGAFATYGLFASSPPGSDTIGEMACGVTSERRGGVERRQKRS